MTIFSSTMFWLFMGANLINVILNTVKSLITIKGGKWLASVTNAICFGFYTVIIVITATYDMPLIYKCIAVAFVNFVGVFSVKLIEEKLEKDKMWIIIATAKVSDNCLLQMVDKLKVLGIKLRYDEIKPNELYTLDIFSNNKKESEMIKAVLENYNIHYTAVEAKKF